MSDEVETDRAARRTERRRRKRRGELATTEAGAAETAETVSVPDDVQSEGVPAGDDAGAGPEAPPRRRGSRDRRYVVGQFVALAVVLSFPWLPFVSYSVLGRANLGGEYALVAISLVVLTGWVGQVSLGQAAFVGVGAYTTGIAQQAWNLGFPANLAVGLAAGALTAMALGTVALRVRGLYLAVATLIFSWTADAFLFQQEWLIEHSSISLDPIGQPGTYPFLDFTSRRTFYYLVWATVALTIFAMANLRDRKGGRAFFAIRGSEMAAASLGIDVVRTKLTAFAISGGIAGLAGSLMLAESQVVVQEQFDLSSSLFFLAIAVVGGLASLPGAVAAGLLFAGLEEVFFRFPAIGNYLQMVSAVLLALVLLLYPGGLAALGRNTWARVQPYVDRALDTLGERTERLFAALPSRAGPDDQAVAPADPAVAAPAPVVPGEDSGDPRSLPSWLEPVARSVRQPVERFRSMQEARRQVRHAAVYVDFAAALWVPEEEEGAGGDAFGPGVPNPPNGNGNGAGGHEHANPEYLSWEDMEIVDPELSVADRERRRPLIRAEQVTVRFGGLTAVNGFSMAIREGEIVGLIGPNGAGKTTSFNSIAGFNTPAEGRIEIHGVDVTSFPVYLRSRLGVARTFQAIQLFPQLNVFDNLMVATYVTDTSGLLGNMFASNRSIMEELAARQRVTEVITLLQLEDVADRTVADLPFGVLRMVEIARALVTGAPVIMLDEPASGLDDMETQRLSKLIRFIRSLGVTILLIEHDVQMVTSISDYMYVIDQGTPIAEGTPEEIKRNPSVIAAYLGEETTDDDTDAETMSEVGS